jgi:BTB/POZ domain
MYDSYGRPISTPTAISEGLRYVDTHVPTRLFVDIVRLFNNSEYSDLVLKCKDRSWKVHRVIVCGRCEFFKACVDRNFKVSDIEIILYRSTKMVLHCRAKKHRMESLICLRMTLMPLSSS